MDANGLRFWMLAEREQWFIRDTEAQVQYDQRRRSLQLASTRLLSPLTEADAAEGRAEADVRLAHVPQARDDYGTRAYWNPADGAVVATGALPDTVELFVPPVGDIPTDLTMGHDGVLYVAIAGRVVLLDRRDRWSPVSLETADFTAWRLAPEPTGGVWVLDRANRRLGRVQGLPLRERPHAEYAPGTFRPSPENPQPPTLTVLPEAGWDAAAQPVALACSPGGRVAVLNWVEGAEARVQILTSDRQWAAPVGLRGVRHPYSLAWVSDDAVAVLVPRFRTEALVYPVVDGADEAEPTGDIYPLRDHDGGPFIHGLDLPPHYGGVTGSAPLHRLSLPSWARQGTALNNIAMDSGSVQTVWHRLYLEASIPASCRVQVGLAATNEPVAAEDLETTIPADDWHEHRFGGGALSATDPRTNTPQGAWVSYASEIPHHPGFVQCEREPGRAGLFTVLIQRGNRRVRSMRGRFLHVRVVLFGNGRTTPEIWAVRAYASRFSYVDNYLPELYRESEFGPEAEAVIRATEPRTSTPADFLERFLNNFEGVLTPLEDRVANAYVLTDPYTTPEEALEWLGSWIGLSFDPAYPPARRRQLLAAAPQLYRRRGTLPGLRQALNIATGNAVDGGQIVIVEDFRLRRVLATILGADFADEEDPLLGGLVVSGNSIVGNTLVLGEEERMAFLALFAADMPLKPGEAEAVQAFFDQLAYRVTVLVHQEVEPQNVGLIRRIVDLETPAHVLARVVTASYPFLVGMASLVGVDSYLAPEPAPRAVRVGQSYLGFRDLIQRAASLDPRLEGRWRDMPWTEHLRPLADAGDDMDIELGASFALDASRSQAAPGRHIARYRWRQVE